MDIHLGDLRLRWCKCNWCMESGMLIRQCQVGVRLFGIPERYSHAKHLDRFVACCGMELLDS